MPHVIRFVCEWVSDLVDQDFASIIIGCLWLRMGLCRHSALQKLHANTATGWQLSL